MSQDVLTLVANAWGDSPIHRGHTRIMRVSGLNKGFVAMYVEYLVLQADAEQGPFARVRAQKLNQSWNTLQDALAELGQHEGDLCTTIYSATRERGAPAEHYCEGVILKRVSYTAGGSAPVPERMPEPSDF